MGLRVVFIQTCTVASGVCKIARLTKTVVGGFVSVSLDAIDTMPCHGFHIEDQNQIPGIKAPECQRYHDSSWVVCIYVYNQVTLFMTMAFKHFFHFICFVYTYCRAGLFDLEFLTHTRCLFALWGNVNKH
jgi:hypothetical protein